MMLNKLKFLISTGLTFRKISKTPRNQPFIKWDEWIGPLTQTMLTKGSLQKKPIPDTFMIGKHLFL